MSTLEGARLYHDGQFEGLRAHIPVFVDRGPDETPDEDLRAFYERLLRAVADADLRDGEWRLCECTGWPDNDSHRQLVAWCWTTGASRHLIVVNLSGAPAQAQVHMPWGDLGGRGWELTDRLDGRTFPRDGDQMALDGLYVGVDPWGTHFLAFAAS